MHTLMAMMIAHGLGELPGTNNTNAVAAKGQASESGTGQAMIVAVFPRIRRWW